MESELGQAVESGNLAAVSELLKSGGGLDQFEDGGLSLIQRAICDGDEDILVLLLDAADDLTFTSKKPQTRNEEPSRGVLLRTLRRLGPILFWDVPLSVLCDYCTLWVLIYTASRCSGWASPISDAMSTVSGRHNPLSMFCTGLPYDAYKSRLSNDFKLHTLDKLLLLGFIMLGYKLLPSSSSVRDFCEQILFSTRCSYKTMFIYKLIWSFFPGMRRNYFLITLGNSSAVGKLLTRGKDVDSDADTGASKRKLDVESVMLTIIRYGGNSEQMMLLFLHKANFTMINEVHGPGHRIMLWASKRGFSQVIESLLAAGISIDIHAAAEEPESMFNYDGLPSYTALYLAAYDGHAALVDLLLSRGAQQNVEGCESPLIGAVEGSKDVFNIGVKEFEKIVDLLLKANFDPNSHNRNGRSALGFAISSRQLHIASLLIDAGADPNLADKQQATPLHHAARYGDQEIVRLLLEAGADANVLDNEGTSALTWAAWIGSCPTVRLLLNAGSLVNTGGGRHGSPLIAAARYGGEELLETILKAGADPNSPTGGLFQSPLSAVLHKPSHMGEEKLTEMRMLVKKGANVNARLDNEKQAIHVAAEQRCEAKIFELLISHGANVNSSYKPKNSFGYTGLDLRPLGILCHMSCFVDAAMVLIKAGANPSCVTPCAEPVLNRMCGFSGSDEVAKELIERGADINARSVRDGDTAMHEAAVAGRSKIVLELISRGANVEARNLKKQTPLHALCIRHRDSKTVVTMEILFTVGNANPVAKDEKGATPLHYAAKSGSLLTVNMLVDWGGLDLRRQTDASGKIPLHWAAEAGETSALSLLLDLESTGKQLQEVDDEEIAVAQTRRLRKQINTQDDMGNTALHYAAKNGHAAFVTAVMACFPDLKIKNRRGLTAWGMAVKAGHIWVVDALKDGEKTIQKMLDGTTRREELEKAEGRAVEAGTERGIS